MSAAAAVLAGRAAAEALMVDSCTITKPGQGRGSWNESTGDYDPPARVVVYSGPCRVQVPNQAEQTADAGDATFTVLPLVLQLPVVGSEGVQVGHLSHLDTATFDPSLVGREYVVRALHAKTHATARRLRCEEVTSSGH